MTQEIVKYMNMPQEEKKKRKENRSNNKTDNISGRWFGLLPFALKLLIQKKK
ncbi:hypothetical protein JOC48_000151 [Aquibacillus albus]|uniref:YqzE family protein n=2 Tax=Aquibacillus albus TaxID=1168171 RepID=A0ABS2MV10_9BACI|nr:hypothetical protein [Aquibacillus albus]